MSPSDYIVSPISKAMINIKGKKPKSLLETAVTRSFSNSTASQDIHKAAMTAPQSEDDQGNDALKKALAFGTVNANEGDVNLVTEASCLGGGGDHASNGSES